MKRLSILFALLIGAIWITAQSFTLNHVEMVAQKNTTGTTDTLNSGDTLNESFETPGTGYENTWTTNGVTDAVYALPGSPPSRLGSQSLRCNRTDATTVYAYWDKGAFMASDLYWRQYVYFDSESIGSTDKTSVGGMAESTTPLTAVAWYTMLVDTGGALSLKSLHNGVLSTGIGVSLDTWYRVEVHYKPNTASGLEMRVYNMAGSQITDSPQSLDTTNNIQPRYLFAGMIYSDNTANFDLVVDGIGLSTNTWIGQ